MSAPSPRLVASPEEATCKYLLFGADTPNTWKIATLVEELEIPYEVCIVDIMKDEQKTPAYLAMNPNGRTPTLVDRSDPTRPFAVFESGAIMLYLCDKHPSSLLPTDSALRSEVTQWLFWQVSALGPMMGQLMYMKRIAHGGAGIEVERLAFGIERFQNECARLYTILERQLEHREWLCGAGERGSYTIADIACWGYAAQHWWAGIDVSTYPSVRKWIDRVGARLPIQTGIATPGVSVLGEGGATFAQFLTDAALRDRIVASAEARGASYFGWRDLTALKTGGRGASGGQVAFSSHVPRNSAGKPSSTTSQLTNRDGGRLLLAALVGAVLALGARRLL